MKGAKPMNYETNGQLCPNCKTGADSYKLDPRSRVCPYQQYYKNKRCPFYAPIKESEVKDDEGV